MASAQSPTFALCSGNGVLVLRAGSLLVRWDGLEVQLGFAPLMINGQPYAHALDLQKTIQPLLEGGASLRLGSNPVLVIDPGHGGENAGTRSVLGNHYEKDFTLDWALRLQKLLTDRGWQIFLTRSNDSDLALSNRVAVAAEHKADLFLSLHFNSAAPSQSEAGLETYCLTPAGMPSSLTRGFTDDLATAFPNNAFDAQNLWLALEVHRSLLKVNGHNDRGVRRARFPGVLRGQQRAAILIEGGYLSNPNEARRISDPSYRQKLAEAVAGALEGAGRLARTVRSQDLPDRNREAEVSSRRVEVRGTRSEVGGQRAEARGPNSEETSHTAEIP
ncbi:MAG TPA: N-acetylmuramoyl-L-alanine amidase [Candidatus Acidoferrum sp.]|nr:N-acetylmuramoyl-L-alanine amidase [Candidatus Acidoferrum sp.]